MVILTFDQKKYWKYLLITLAPTNSNIAREQTKLLEFGDIEHNFLKMNTTLRKEKAEHNT